MEWVTSKEVRDAFGVKPGRLYEAGSEDLAAVLQRASLLWVRARAKAFCEGGSSTLNAIIPMEFWRNTAPSIFSQDWERGDFILTPQGGPRVSALGVRFSKDDLELMGLDPSIKPPNKDKGASGRGRGGAPRNEAAWDRFWMALLELSHEERLTRASFNSQADLRKELCLMMGDALEDRTIKPKVSQVWKRFIDKGG